MTRSQASEKRERLTLQIGRLALILEGGLRIVFVLIAAASSSLLVGILLLPPRLMLILTAAVMVALMVAGALAMRGLKGEVNWLMSVAYLAAAFLLLLEIRELLRIAVKLVGRPIQ